jgi:hypothetical protein
MWDMRNSGRKNVSVQSSEEERSEEERSEEEKSEEERRGEESREEEGTWHSFIFHFSIGVQGDASIYIFSAGV